MRGLPQKQNARRADKIKLCGHLRRYKKIVKKTYIILLTDYIDSQEEYRQQEVEKDANEYVGHQMSEYLRFLVK